jgi:hypothetical protein
MAEWIGTCLNKFSANFGWGFSLLQVEEAYTTDGSLDIDGNPALKHRTGGWRACRSILGMLN